MVVGLIPLDTAKFGAYTALELEQLILNIELVQVCIHVHNTVKPAIVDTLK